MIHNLEQFDSLNYINRIYLKQIKEYESEIKHLEKNVDSLNKIKNKIIIKRDEVIVSDNVSSAVNTLKLNLDK